MLLVIKTDEPVICSAEKKSNLQNEEMSGLFFTRDKETILVVSVLFSDTVLKGCGFSAESHLLCLHLWPLNGLWIDEVPRTKKKRMEFVIFQNC